MNPFRKVKYLKPESTERLGKLVLTWRESVGEGLKHKGVRN